MPAIRYPLLATLLRRYFYSGWAFLIPYLATYLLYYITGWPVNPSETGAAGAASAPLTPLTTYSSYGFLPSLLHLYWSLHALHLILAALALRSWCTETSAQYVRNASDAQSAPYSSYRLHLLTRIAPWAILALIFYIPGVYLEWPSDPWEHLRRINEWHFLDQVTAHSTWSKSSYFLPYSLSGHATGLAQLGWLNVYYSGICLLLSWQYYRLARAANLGNRSSFIFVFLQALLMGNNIFSFYRYYGLSSSIFAQLGAVAIIRVALEALQPQDEFPADGRSAVGLHPSVVHSRVAVLWQLPLLATLIAFNHIQGLGIAGLGVASVVIWRLIEWRKWTIPLLIITAIALSVAAVVWWPRHPSFDIISQQQGWLTTWHSFNFFSPSSPAIRPTLAILGFFGVLNLLAGILLLSSRHVVASLTLIPLLLLSMPAVAVPMASMITVNLVSADVSYLITFPRMLFAIPAGLALVVYLDRKSQLDWNLGHPAVYLGLLILVALPASAPVYNRLFNALMAPPHDLSMRPALASVREVPAADRIPLAMAGNRLEVLREKYGGIITPPGIGYVLNATGTTLIARTARSTLSAPVLGISPAIDHLPFAERAHRRAAVPYWQGTTLFTATPQSGRLSGHWLTQNVALQLTGQPELLRAVTAVSSTLPKQDPQLWLDWSDGRGLRHTGDPGPTLPPFAIIDRGLLERAFPEAQILAGDRVVFRPFLRTSNGNGWQLTLILKGPDGVTQRDFTGLPDPLGGIGYVSGEYSTRLSIPGEYDLELIGRTLWPREIRTVRYKFTARSE